jgi:hypothetical protein
MCPLVLCRQQMHPETSRFHAGYDSTTGLRYFRCPACGHTGMVAAGGVQLVFRFAQQYVLTYDPFLSTITVILPPCLIAMGQTYGLEDEEVAKHAADWTLLSGNKSDTLTLIPEGEEFFDFTGYLSSLTLPTLSKQPLNRHTKEGRTRPEELAQAWSVGATSAAVQT